MNAFKTGVCNTLIATCVAEEGIDVGEVDLIVCFDVNNKNPIRYIQRIGRTGRKRQGKVIMLVTEGKEQNILRNVMATKDGTNQKITRSSDVTSALYRESTRMVPPEFHPKCIETFVKIVNEPTNIVESTKDAEPSTSRTAKKAKTKKKERVQPPRSAKQPDIRQAIKRIEIDEEMRRDFVVSGPSAALDTSLATLNTSMVNNLLVCDEIKTDPKPSHQRSTEEISMQHKLIRICERYREIKKCSNAANNEPLEAAAVINNNKIPKPLKLLWLRNNLEFVREHHINQGTSRLYSAIANIFGGEQAVQRLLTAPTEHWSDLKPKRQMTIFQMLKIVDRKTKENVPVENAPPIVIDRTEAMAFESQSSLSYIDPDIGVAIYDNTKSKYASQFETQLAVPSSSTDHMSSSTPKRINRIAESKIQPPIDSPIKNTTYTTAFKKTLAKNKNLDPESVPHYLRYFGLTSIDDLFLNSDEEDNPEPQPNAIENSKTKSATNASEADLFADESYAIAQPSATVAPTLNTTTSTGRRRLNVGSISDLFRDDDFDDDAVGNDSIGKVENETISKTGSDDTEDYDFEKILSIMEAAEAAVDQTSKALCTSQMENENENNVQRVAKHKSDDLFSTFNDTTNTTANRMSVDEINASKFALPSPSDANDKKRRSLCNGISDESNSQQSPSSRLNCAIIQDRSPSMLCKSLLRSQSGVSSKSLLSKFNATIPSAQSDTNISNHIGSPSTSAQPKKLNFSRLRANAAVAADNMTDVITTSPPFLTCGLATSNDRQTATANRTVNSSSSDQIQKNISTESQTSDDDEIFATCKMVFCLIIRMEERWLTLNPTLSDDTSTAASSDAKGFTKQTKKEFVRIHR